MPGPIISETLNIKITHATPGPTPPGPTPTPDPTPVDPNIPVPHTSGAGAPNTGFFESIGDNVSNFVGHMSITGWLFLLVTILLITAGILCLVWRSKFKHKASTFFSLFLFAFAIGFTIPSINAVSEAIGFTAGHHTTNFDITADTTALPVTIDT